MRLFVLFVVLSLGSLVCPASAASHRPNIVFILVDDQGYYDLGCFGATEVETPHLDRLADGGVRFTDYYAAAPICSPSRAGLLTGCYPRRIGLHTWVQRADSRLGLHPSELTLPELLKTNGDAPVHAMDWYPTLASFAGVHIPAGRVIDGRDLRALLTGKSPGVPEFREDVSLNATVPLRRGWNPPGEWKDLVSRREYLGAFFYHRSHGALAAVRSGRWKLHLHPTLTLYNLADDPGERSPVRNGKIARKLRGMAVLFQEEMRRNARPAGDLTGAAENAPDH